MAFIFRKEEKAKQEEQMIIVPLLERRPMWQTSFHFFTLVLILVFVNWGAPFALDKGLWTFIFTYKLVYYGSSCSDALLVACPNIEIASIMGMCRSRDNDCFGFPCRRPYC